MNQRDYERVQHIHMSGPDHLILGNVYHVGCANNETVAGRIGKAWVWELSDVGERLLAGPFESNTDAMAWALKLLPLQTAKQLGLTFTPPPPRVSRRTP